MAYQIWSCPTSLQSLFLLHTLASLASFCLPYRTNSSLSWRLCAFASSYWKWKDWCWGWNSNKNLATSWEELTHWKRPWYWEGLGAGGEGDDRGWDGWMASPTWWTWVWVNSGNWWWTGKPGVLWFMVLQGVGHDWATELNWLKICFSRFLQGCFFLIILFQLKCRA